MTRTKATIILFVIFMLLFGALVVAARSEVYDSDGVRLEDPIMAAINSALGLSGGKVPNSCPNCGSKEVKEGETYLVTHYKSKDDYHSSGLYLPVNVCKECGVLYVKKNAVEAGK